MNARIVRAVGFWPSKWHPLIHKRQYVRVSRLSLFGYALATFGVTGRGAVVLLFS